VIPEHKSEVVGLVCLDVSVGLGWLFIGGEGGHFDRKDKNIFIAVGHF
jgi:hypothetical protein